MLDPYTFADANSKNIQYSSSKIYAMNRYEYSHKNKITIYSIPDSCVSKTMNWDPRPSHIDKSSLEDWCVDEYGKIDNVFCFSYNVLIDNDWLNHLTELNAFKSYSPNLLVWIFNWICGPPRNTFLLCHYIKSNQLLFSKLIKCL